MALTLAAPVVAQTPPDCNHNICTVQVAGVYGSRVVDGCGDHATPGRFKVILSSTNPNVTRASFPTLIPLGTDKDGQTRSDGNPEFNDWEWRGGATGTTWYTVQDNFQPITFSAQALGESIVEVRPKAGAHIWGRAGEMVIPVISANTVRGTRGVTGVGETHFFFMGGKGCARVNHAGETDGTIQ